LSSEVGQAAGAWHKRLYSTWLEEQAIGVNRPYLRPGDQTQFVVLL